MNDEVRFLGAQARLDQDVDNVLLPRHTIVEISYSNGYTAKEPRSEFVYELIGTEGVIRYHRNARSFDVRTAAGTEILPVFPEKDFTGMYRAFAAALSGEEAHDLPTAEDGLTTTRLARSATDQVIAGRLGR